MCRKRVPGKRECAEHLGNENELSSRCKHMTCNERGAAILAWMCASHGVLVLSLCFVQTRRQSEQMCNVLSHKILKPPLI